MAAHLSFLLILTGLTGTNSITTVREVSVKTGDSITIPCLYRSQYKDHVKYLCEGYYWSSCSYAVKTNQPQNSQKFSISDDKSRSIFNVTVKHLTDKDAHYWCAVEINGGSDVKEYFHLSVTRGTPRLYVDHQEITGFNGEEITINCIYSNPGEIKWCRLGSSCVTEPSGSIGGTSVTINTSVPNVFTVTMSELRTESSGWYWCAQGHLQMPVHVTVTEKLATTTNCLTSVSLTPESVKRVPVALNSFIISLSVLIFIVMVTLFIWFLLKRHRQTKVESSATPAAKEEVVYSFVKTKKKTSDKVEEELTYSNFKHMKKTSNKRSGAKSDVDMIYSSVVTGEQQNAQRVEAEAENVTYSRLAQHHQNL